MRESLTILAIGLIVVLTTALVGPYFVDWNAHRGAIETRLSALLGAKVTVRGPIDVKLLPRPIFRLGDVAVAGPSPRAPAAAADRLDVELALTALLRGEFVFVDADLTAPRLTLVAGADGAVVLPRFAATDPDHVSLSHVTLHDGSVLVVGEDGKPVLSATGLAGDGEAESLVGPFRFAGQLDTARGVLGFRLGTGAIDDGKLRIKMTMDAVAGLPKTDAEGVITLAEVAGGASVPHFDGSFVAADSLKLAGGDAVVPWKLGSRVTAGADGVALTALELRAGVDGRALVMAGEGHLGLGAAPRAAFTLHARQADLPRFAAAAGVDDKPAGATAAANTATMLAGLRALAADPDLFGAVPVPLTVDYAVDALTFGHLTLSALTGRLALAPKAPLTGSLSIDAADGSHIALAGSFESGPAAVFKGRLDATTHDLGRFAESLRPDLPDVAQALSGALPVRSFAFGGAIDLSGVGFAAHDADLAMDGSRFAGTITLTRAVGADRARLFADLTSEALDLDVLPAWRDTAGAGADLDLSISLIARAVRLAQSDTGSVDTGRMTLQLSKTGPAVTLDRLSLADIGGATADLTGHSDGHAAHIEGRLDARRLRDLLALAKRLVPGQTADRLAARADALSPALLTVAADATLDAASRPSLSRASIDGTLAGTSLSLRLAPADAGFKGGVKLEAPEAGALLRQLGIATLPTTAVGRSRIEADARLDSTLAPLEGSLTATLADTVLAFEGKRTGTAGLAGTVTVKGGNIAPLARAVALASPETGAVWPVEAKADLTVNGSRVALANIAGRVFGSGVKGNLAYVPPQPETTASAGIADTQTVPPPALTGALAIERLPLPALVAIVLGPLPTTKAGAPWPDAPFTTSLAILPRTAIGLEIADLPLTPTLAAADARMDLKVAPGLVTLANLSGRIGEGRIGGTFDLRRDARTASLSGHAQWSGLSSTSPSFGGRCRGVLDIAGTGTSVATLVASLAGSGSVGVDDARLPRLDVGALNRAVSAKGEAASTIDDAEIRQAVTADLDKGALPLGSVATPATVAAGVLRGEPIIVQTPAVRATTVAALDLRSLLLTLTSTLLLPTPPKDWVGSPPQVTVSWSGPFTAPAREVDATALVNGIAARAIARDQARIEDFQDDIRERAFFARRLRAIEAEQQAARDKTIADQNAQLEKLLQSLPGPAATSPTATAPSRAAPRPGASVKSLDPSPKALQPTP